MGPREILHRAPKTIGPALQESIYPANHAALISHDNLPTFCSVYNNIIMAL